MNALAPIAAQEVRFHEYANLFPMLTGQPFDELVADIAANGVREPVVFMGDTILDGRNRYMAAREAGVECPRVNFEGDDPLSFVISTNLHRRHLSESQRAMVATRLAKMGHGGDRRSEKTEQAANLPLEIVPANDPDPAPITQKDAAGLLNVSPRSVRAARVVENEGIPDLAEAVDRGDIKVSAAAEIARLPKEEQPEAIEQKIVNRTSFTGNNEWYTPAEYIEVARTFLGGFDLDPASSDIANETVQAERFFTESDNGLEQDWQGRVWLNPPYAQPAIGEFIEKAVAEFDSGRVTGMIVLTHNYTDTRWFQTGAANANAICFTRGRIRFEGPNGEKAAPTQGQAFFYFGDDVAGFHQHFASIGFVVQVMK